MRIERLIDDLRRARRLTTQWERSGRMDSLRASVLKLKTDEMRVIRRRLRVPREDSISSWVVGSMQQLSFCWD